MRQLTMEFAHPPAQGRADFLASACNAAALGWVERWPDWPERTLVLHGPPAAGKSHLAALWRERSRGRLIIGAELDTANPHDLADAPAVAVDDAEAAREEALLHLYNCCRESGAGLLVVARAAPSVWPIALADLASRLRAAPSAGIDLPDDRLLAALVVKHFADRQLRIPPEVVDLVVQRGERSFAAIAAIADRLDRASLDTHRPITPALARRILAEPDQDAG